MTRDDIAKAAEDDARALCEKLTDVQRHTLILLCKGMTVAEVAAADGLSYWTVSERAKAVTDKLGVGSRIEAAVLATKAGLV